MNKLTNHFGDLLNRHIKLKQWLWLILLWMTGFMGMLAIAYPLKWLVRSLG